MMRPSNSSQKGQRGSLPQVQKQKNYELDQLKKKVKELEERNKNLTNQQLQNLEEMIEKQQQQIIFLDNLRQGKAIFNSLEDLKNQLEISLVQIQSYRLDETLLGQYKFSHKSDQNFSDLIKDIKQKADSDKDSWTQYSLAQLYYDGDKQIEKDYKKSLEYAKLSAEQNCPAGQCLVGSIYLFGRGVEKNHEKALEYIKKASEQNYAYADNLLGLIYAVGLGTKPDEQKSQFHYQRGSDLGNIHAQHAIGMIYQTQQQLELAIYYFNLAAQKGNSLSMEELIKIYSQGQFKNEQRKKSWEKMLKEHRENYEYQKNETNGSIKEQPKEEEEEDQK